MQKWKITFCATASMLFFMGCFYALQVEPNWIEVKKYNISSNSSQAFTIAHLSDIHLDNLSYRENKLKQILEEKVKPDILVFSGDTFDSIGEGQKIELSKKTTSLIEYIASLPGEKILVWGEGINNNRHQIGKELKTKGIKVLEDETIFSKNIEKLTITGKLPELASFSLTKQGYNTYLNAGASNLNSYLHVVTDDSFQWQDYEFTGEFRFDKNAGGMGLTFYSQYTPISDRFYRIRWSGNNSRPYLSTHGTGVLGGKLQSGIALQFGQTYFFKIRGQTIPKSVSFKAKFWPKNSPEPKGWDIEAIDKSADRLNAGTVGVWVSGPIGDKVFDDFIVKSLGDSNDILFQDFFEDRNQFKKQWYTERNFKQHISPREVGEFNLLLAHTPEIINNYKIKNFDIILTGDTHGGQVCWPWGAPIVRDRKLPPDWYSGLHNLNNQSIYVNKGIGTSRLPIRLFCRPEIAVFKVQ